MSVFVEMFVPYRFNDLSCKEKVDNELEAIKNKVASFFHVSECFILEVVDYSDDIKLNDNELSFDYCFHMPIQDLGIELGNGFLKIDGGWNYSQYFYALGGKSWLRYMHFDLLRALGYSEAYIMDEYHGSNHAYPNNVEFGNTDMNFDIWKKENPNPPILPMSVLYDPKIDERPEIESVYLDKFEDCKERLNALQIKFPKYEILTIDNFSGDFILALDENRPIIVNENTGDILPCGKIDGINVRFNGAGFEIYHDKESAFFSFDGVQRTPFRNGKFSWHWKGFDDAIEVYDDSTGEVIYTTPR